MANKPYPKTLTGTSVEILNAIRNSASTDYKTKVPIATPDSQVVKSIGAVIMDNVSLQNEFINTLVNRIAFVRISSKLYENPIAMFKKGVLEFGETIEEIFVGLVKAFEFDPEEAETTLYKREIPDVRTAFHILNYKKFYKITVSREMLHQAFLSIEGVTDLIEKIIEQVYTSANYDEFQVMKYMVAKKIIMGQLSGIVYNSTGADPMKDLVKKMKSVSNKMEFMNPNYNIAGVRTHTVKADQYLLVNADADAEIDVDVLASAFNMDKVEFLGHRVMVDGFGTLDTERLDMLFEDNENYMPITPELSEALNQIPAILIDGDWFQVYDNLLQMEEAKNGQGLYWNYFYHTWKTFSVSPFAQGVIFLPEESTVTSVTITAQGNSFYKNEDGDGKVFMYGADVETSGIGVSKEVTWSIDESTVVAPVTASITSDGILTVFRPENHGSWTGIKVIATSVENPEVVGEITT